MKVNAQVRNEWLVVPSKDKSNTVEWLGNQALSRYRQMHSYVSEDEVAKIIKPSVGSRLSPSDLVVDVLDDNAFVKIVLKSDTRDKSFDEYGAPMDISPIRTGGADTRETLYLDGGSLTPDDLVKLGRGVYKIQLTKDAWDKVIKSRQVVTDIVKENRVVYGINTGFGKFATVTVGPHQLSELQENLIRSHCVGVGRPLSPQHTRKLLALRINILSKGFSGISVRVLEQLIEAFNASCLSVVPCKGTVGASGDLAPLAHLALGLMGEGDMWSPESGFAPAKDVLAAHNLTPIELGPKEGLALINGTQFITSLGVEAMERAKIISRQADVVAAMTLEALRGTNAAYESCIHRARPHTGQMLVAARLKSLLHSDVHNSEIVASRKAFERIQDAYSLRCIPQVHGVVHDTIQFVNGILTTEMNSATDNPMVFSDTNRIISAGNFHGEYPAKVCDYLAIAVHELANISERRTERLNNPDLSKLPAFLTKEEGLNSGFMIAHYTSAALVSENKVLTHPSSADTLSTSAAQEDHVSMGGFAARKALEVVEHVEHVLAIELMCACQGIEFARPLKTTAPLEAVQKLVRTVVPPLERDRHLSVDMEAIAKLLRENKVWEAVRPFVENYQAEELKRRA